MSNRTPDAPAKYERHNEQVFRQQVETRLRKIESDIQTNSTNLATLIATLTTKGVLP
jgi:hypothetical protein